MVSSFLHVYDGGIAQLVRAFASHARGRGFESLCLHHLILRGCGSVGRALASHARGQGFESPHLHQCNQQLAGSITRGLFYYNVFEQFFYFFIYLQNSVTIIGNNN